MQASEAYRRLLAAAKDALAILGGASNGPTARELCAAIKAAEEEVGHGVR